MRTNRIASAWSKNKDNHVPVIVLQGFWLKNLGFETGMKYCVEEKPGELTVRLLPPEVKGQKET